MFVVVGTFRSETRINKSYKRDLSACAPPPASFVFHRSISEALTYQNEISPEHLITTMNSALENSFAEQHENDFGFYLTRAGANSHLAFLGWGRHSLNRW